MSNFDKTWHLAQNEENSKIAELEIQLWRVYYSFLRWQEECEKSVNGTQLTGSEIAVLHIIRMQEKPKASFDIGRLLNRDDTFNIKYSIQKLLKLKLIEKAKLDQDVKAIHYQVTELGRENTDNFTKAKKLVLTELFNQEPELNLVLTTKALTKIKSIYDEAIRVVASYTKYKKPAIEKDETNNL